VCERPFRVVPSTEETTATFSGERLEHLERERDGICRNDLGSFRCAAGVVDRGGVREDVHLTLDPRALVDETSVVERLGQRLAVGVVFLFVWPSDRFPSPPVGGCSLYRGLTQGLLHVALGFIPSPFQGLGSRLAVPHYPLQENIVRRRL
jgi:hypothetical protein